LLALERRLVRGAADVRALVPQIRALQQGLWDDWGSSIPIVMVPANTLTVQVLDNGTAAPIAGAGVDLCDLSGDILQTLLTNGSGLAVFTPAVGTYNLGGYAVGYGAESDAGVIVLAGANTHGMLLSPGSFFLPDDNRTLIDPVYGTITLPWSSTFGGTHSWVKTITVNYVGACSGCASVSGVTVTYGLASTSLANSLTIKYREIGGGNHCPAVGAVNRTITPSIVATGLPELHFTTASLGIPLYCTAQPIVVQ
jgi:hypothetical protein